MLYGEITGVDKPVSRLVLGSMAVNVEDTDAGFALLDAALARGYSTIDVAHIYGGGKTERVIGQWQRQRNVREQIVIMTKGCHHNADRKRVTPFDITSDLHDSLARLQTDYIDVYLLHRDDPDVEVGPIVDVLNEHLAAGRIRSFGGSNWSCERIQAANDYARSRGLVGFAASSPNYSLAWQKEIPWPGCITIGGPDNLDSRQWYIDTQMPVMAYSSLGRGFLTGRLSRSNFESVKSELDPACLKGYCYEPNFERLDRAEKLAAELGVTVPMIAMAFVLSQSMNVFALVGARNENELEGNLAALELKLDQNQLNWLENG